MRELQKTLLNTIKPGDHPIIIVAPDNNTGNLLSSLLSDKLIPGNFESKLSGSNFFLKDIFLSDKSESKKETAKLIISENIDNKKYWGVQCSYELFNELNLGSLFHSSFFFFIYDNDPKLQHASVIDFYRNNEERVIILNADQIRAMPEVILKSLPLSPSVKLKEIGLVADEIIYPITTNLQTSNETLDHYNFLVKNSLWLRGSDVAVFLIIKDKPNKQFLTDKLNVFLHSFLSPPSITVFCPDEQSKRTVEELSGKLFESIANIQAVVQNGSLAKSLNSALRQSDASYCLIDDLSITYSPVKTVLPLLRDENLGFSIPCYAFDIQNAASDKISEIDILTIQVVPSNIALAIGDGSTQVFDEDLDDNLIIWDWAIRKTTARADGLLINAIIPGSSGSVRQSKAFAPDMYEAVVKKHLTLFQDNFFNIISSLSEHQALGESEVKALNEKINTQNSLLAHSKDELKSINELNKELQQRIAALENKKIFKLSRKLGKVKRIFFKKQTPGTRNIQRSLRFFVFMFTKAGYLIIKRLFKAVFRKLYIITEDRPIRIVYLDSGNEQPHVDNYQNWILRKLSPDVLRADYEANIGAMDTMPKISIVMPVYNPLPAFLKAAIESVMGQLYSNWELCMADDCSPNPQIAKLLEGYALKDPRIKVTIRKENGHISAASNSALELATGEYILFMDHDDLLTANCCFEVVKHINKKPDLSDIIYSDEDKIDGNGHYSVPHFKPDWAPHNLLSRNYLGHIVVVKKDLVDQVKGFRLGFEGSQDYDILLRLTELTDKIGHIPKVLYHWRIHELSAAQSEEVKPYAYIAAKKALEEALIRRNTPGEVQYLSGLRGYRILYNVIKPGKVSIIIPTKDQTNLLRNAIDSIITKTNYGDYEIIVLNNNSNTKEFFDLMDHYSKTHPTVFRCIEANFPFNFSRLMNVGVSHANGDYILFLNNDVEVIQEDWMTRMVSFAQHKNTGIVGCKLLYPDDTIQHAGVIVGLGGVAGHSFVHFHKDDAGYFNYIQSLNNYSALTAACIMFRKDIYKEVDGMDEAFEVEYNDVDFCLKVLDKGYYNVYVPDVTLYHYESATRGHPLQNKASYARHVKEMDLFISKWEKYIKHDPFYNPNLSLGVHDFGQDFSK
jgi:GT2 family glycosyltransferase